MSTRFYAGPISSGMARNWEDWDQAAPSVEAHLNRWRASVVRPHVVQPMRAAPPPDSHHPLADPIAPHR